MVPLRAVIEPELGWIDNPGDSTISWMLTQWTSSAARTGGAPKASDPSTMPLIRVRRGRPANGVTQATLPGLRFGSREAAPMLGPSEAASLAQTVR
jgi:hypothetical protein